MLLGGNAISALCCAQEQEAGTQLGWQRHQLQWGQPGLRHVHGGCPQLMALLQLPEANACLVAHLLSSRDRIQSLRKGDLHPGKALTALRETSPS